MKFDRSKRVCSISANGRQGPVTLPRCSASGICSGAGVSWARAPSAGRAGGVVPHADFLAALRAVVRPAGILRGDGRRGFCGCRREPRGNRRLLGPSTNAACWEVRKGWLPRLAVGGSSGDPCQA